MSGTHNGSGLMPSLVSQAQTILEAATSLQRQLDLASLPQPSLAPTGRRNWFDAGHLPELLETRLRRLDAAQSMLDLVMGPADTVSYLTGALMTKFEVVRTLNTSNVAAHIPIEGDVSITDLADNIHVDAEVLYRHLRCAYLMNMFRESRKGYIAHTGISAELSNSPYNQPKMNELFVRGTFHVPEAMRSMPKSDARKLVPIELADKERGGRTFWEQITQDDLKTGLAKFSAGMKSLGLALFGGDHSVFARAFDWTGIETLVDVGGGNAHIEVNIAKLLPGVQFVIQDLEMNVTTAQQNIERSGLQDRIRFQAQDFFQAQPTDITPSAYLLSRVLHDRQDDDCVRIVSNLLPAMQQHGTRLFIIDRLMPEIGEMSAYKEWSARSTDMVMCNFYGSKERTLEDFKNILSRVNVGLKVTKCEQPVNTAFGFMEVQSVP